MRLEFFAVLLFGLAFAKATDVNLACLSPHQVMPMWCHAGKSVSVCIDDLPRLKCFEIVVSIPAWSPAETQLWIEQRGSSQKPTIPLPGAARSLGRLEQEDIAVSNIPFGNKLVFCTDEHGKLLSGQRVFSKSGAGNATSSHLYIKPVIVSTVIHGARHGTPLHVRMDSLVLEVIPSISLPLIESLIVCIAFCVAISLFLSSTIINKSTKIFFIDD